MTFQEFEKFSDQFMDDCSKLITSKGHEYVGTGKDRFANFNELAKELNIDRKQVLWVYFYKHYQSVSTFVRHSRLNNPDTTNSPPSEPIQGRIKDLINYLLLLAAMITEEGWQSRSGGLNEPPQIEETVEWAAYKNAIKPLAKPKA